jgi:hypothetical protein
MLLKTSTKSNTKLNKLLKKDKKQLAFAPSSLILANNFLPINRALYGTDIMRLILALVFLISFLCHSNENSGTEFTFFDGTIKIPDNTSIVPIGDFGFIFKVDNNNLFSYEKSFEKFFDVKHKETGELNKIVKSECDLEIVERYFADTNGKEPRFTAHFRKINNSSFMASVISEQSSKFYRTILKQYCKSR